MIPENIKQLANKVRNEIYGRDVRESIAQSMEVSGETSNEANERSKDTAGRQTDVENRFDDQIAGNTDIDEVIDARRPEGGESYPTLRKRLDDEHKEVTAQLAQIAVNVKTLGAKGDGVEDDVEPIQSAIDYVETVGGGNVYIPTGVYNISKSLQVGTNVNIIGAGKGTVIEGNRGVGETTTSMFYNKGRDNPGIYSGASNFSIQNLALNSKNRTMQGIYMDNAKNYYMNRIWGLGKTRDHYFDINNSKNGVVENIYLLHDSNSDFQIDAREGVNDNLTIRNLFITNPNPNPSLSDLGLARSGIHFHRGDSHNVRLSNVYMDGIDIPVFKDGGVALQNVTMENFTLKNLALPIYAGPSTREAVSTGVILSNWKIESNKIRRFAYFARFENLHLKNIDIKISENDADDFMFLEFIDDVTISNISFSGEYKLKDDIYKEIRKSSVTGLDVTESYHGAWTPSLAGSGASSDDDSVEYSIQEGVYNRVGNVANVHGRLSIVDIGNLKGAVFIKNLPYLAKGPSGVRYSGNIGLSNLKNDIIPSVALEGGDRSLFFRKAGTETFITDGHFTPSTYIFFSITYAV